MMTYEEFQNYVLEHTKEYIRAENQGISFQLVPGREGGKEVDLKVIFPHCNYLPYIHLDSAYSTYQKNGDLEFIMNDIAETIHQAGKEVFSFDSVNIKEFENVKNRLSLQLVNRERNKSLLGKVVHRDLPDTDLSVIYYVEISRNESGMQCCKVNASMLNAWKLGEEELYQAALKNMEKQRPFVLHDLMGSMVGFPGKPGYLPEQLYGNEFYSLSTQIANGSAAILYPGLLRLIGERFQSNFFLVPSSVHEMYLIKDEGDDDVASLKQLVKSMEVYPIPDRAFLSDHIYAYNRENERFYQVEERETKREEWSAIPSQETEELDR